MAQPGYLDIYQFIITYIGSQQYKESLVKKVTHHSSFLVDTSHVNPCLKSNRWWIVWIILATKQFQLVDTPFMNSLVKEQDGQENSPSQHNV